MLKPVTVPRIYYNYTMKPPFWIDTHCHIGMCLDRISESDLLKHASENGIGAMIDVGIDGKSNRDVIKRAEEHKVVFAAIGIHPHDSAKATTEDMDFIAENFSNPRVVAIGEIGLDYYRDYSPHDEQKQFFEVQLRFAVENKMPVIIHSRKAWNDTIEIIKKVAAEGPVKGVFHCFGYGPEEAKICVDLGFYVSFPGSLTYEQSKKLQNTAKEIPMKHALIETDAPFMIPAAFKKTAKDNLPGYVVETAKAFAHIREMKIDILKGLLYENAIKCFPKMASELEKA